MNRKGQIGAWITFIFVILIALAIFALIDPVTGPLLAETVDNVGLSGIERLGIK